MNSRFILKSDSKASENLIAEMMVRSIQGAPSTVAARTDHAPLAPAAAFIRLNHTERQVVWQAEPQRAEPRHDLTTLGSELPAVNQDITS